jgi:hypothetical protein
MKEFIQKIKHILYRAKAWVLYKSRPALWFRSHIWKMPSKEVVNILFEEQQDISNYFNWGRIRSPIASAKLKEFTQRYSTEPNLIYEFTGDLYVEPEYGLVINSNREYIRQSGTLGHIFLRPSLVKYLVQKYISKRYTYYDYLIHCDGFAGKNLCHFIYDTINPILFLHERGHIDLGTPILVAQRVFEKPYFQYFLKETFLGELNWVVQQENQWIRSKAIRKAFVSMEIFKTTHKLILGQTNPSRRIFLNRKSYYQRNILNINGVVQILTKFGFENIYAEDLSYAEQVNLFREVKYFVGIHGAGLTNLLHSDIKSLRVLEIFSESLVHASFYRFLEILEIEHYDAVTGTKFDINWNFSIDLDVFEDAVIRLLEPK